MKKIIWLFIIVLCLVPVAFIGTSIFNAPPKDEFISYKSYMAIVQQVVDGKNVDKSVIIGTQEDDKYTNIFADYAIVVQNTSRQLAKEKNFLLILIQPRNLASGQSADVSLEKVADFNKKINEINIERESAITTTATKLNTLDKKKIKIFDVVRFTKTLEEGKAERAAELQEYLGLSQYVGAILEFVKARNGSYSLSEDGKSLKFSTPEDQAYYAQLLAGASQYTKIIDEKIQKRIAEDRKNISALNNK
jgi:hypothetical protein